MSLGFWEWGCPCHCNSGGKRTENLSPQPPRVFTTPQQVRESPIPTEEHNKSVTMFTVLVFCFWSG